MDDSLFRLEQNLKRLRMRYEAVEKPPNNMPRTRDKVKGKVRLRWNHRQSTNLTSYRIDKIATSSLKVYEVEPDPVHLSYEELYRKI